MTYKYAIGEVLAINPILINFNSTFRPMGIVTTTAGVGQAEVESVIVVGVGTVPGNSGSQMKAYAVMRPNGEIGAATEGALKRNVI